MKKIVVLLMIGLVLAAGVGVVGIRIHAQTPVQPFMAEVPSDLENDNPVPMTLQWKQDGKSYYYFSWGMKPTAGYRLEFDGLEKNVMTIRAISPVADDFVAQVLTYPKLILVLPQGNYTYRVIDQFGRKVTSAFQTENKPLFFKVFFPNGEKWASRKVWREFGKDDVGQSRVQIAGEALLVQPEMQLYAQQGVEVLNVSYKGNICEVVVSKAYSQLGYKEKASLTEALRKTIQGLKVKGVKKIEIVTEAHPLSMVEKK